MNVDIEYHIIGLDGTVVSSETEQIVVDGRAQITKTISFPKEIEAGEYVIAAIVKYKSSTGVATQSFTIRDIVSTGNEFSLSGFEGYNFLVLVVVGVILSLGIVLLFIYLLRERDKMLLELKKYNSQEIRQVRDLLKEQRLLLLGRVGVRKPPKRELKKEIGKKIKRLKVKQKVRIKEMSVLKEKGDISGMKRKLAAWKREGYDTLSLDYKMKELSKGEMQSLLKKWKKKYSGK